jgi:hypothetical protein
LLQAIICVLRLKQFLNGVRFSKKVILSSLLGEASRASLISAGSAHFLWGPVRPSIDDLPSDAEKIQRHGDIHAIRLSLDETLKNMRNWQDADKQKSLIKQFVAKANNFNAQLMSTMIIAALLARTKSSDGFPIATI